MRVFKSLLLIITGMFALLSCIAIGSVYLALSAAPDLAISANAPAVNSHTDGNQPEPTQTDSDITVRYKELAALAKQELQRLGIGSAAAIEFSDGQLSATLSARLPMQWTRNVLNVRVIGKPADAPRHVSVERIEVGNLSVPQPVIAMLEPWLVQRCKRDLRCRTALNAYGNIEYARFDADAVHIRYHLGGIRAGSLDANGNSISQLELEPYMNHLAQLGERYDKQAPIPLHVALQAVFGLAQQRSQQSSAIRANTTALLALALQEADSSTLRVMLRNQIDDSPEAKLLLSVHQRRDLAQHFVNSAALYLIGGTDFSDYIGIYKEFYDVSIGKEFGAGDLVADRAGVRLARQATLTEQKAATMQAAILNSNSSAGYLLSKAQIRELEQRYIVRTTEEINEIVTVIDANLARLALLN